jgi:moderate conductance mechanosensitive channel
MKILSSLAIAIVVSCIAVAGIAQAQNSAQPLSDAEKLGVLIETLNDDRLRGQLIGELERLKARTPPSSSPATAPQPDAAAEEQTSGDAGPASENGEDAAVFSGGLATGLSQWLADLGRRLPTAALGAPIDQKFSQAEAQVSRRLSAPGAVDGLQSFGIQSLAGWAIVTALILGAYVFARRRIRARVVRGTERRALIRDVIIRALYAMVPLVLGMTAAVAWTGFASYSDAQKALFVMLCAPLAGATLISGLISALLVLLAPSKGWRLVAYSQRRLAPMIGILTGIATLASIAVTPEIRNVIGPATADILSLTLDIAVPVFAAVIIGMHRRTVRSLIVRGYAAGDETGSVFGRAIYWIGTHWQHFGFVFVILNIGARLFGAQSGGFLAQSSLSVAVIVAAFIAIASIRRFETNRIAAAARRTRSGVRFEIFKRLSAIGYRSLQVIVAVIATSWCLGFWGIDVEGWLQSRAGVSVIGPIVAIVLMSLVAWTLWVVLDAWITATLSQPQTGVSYRERSARVRTLLPLLRNVAFVVLTVLTAIGILANLGINVAPLIAGAGVIGLAVGFGSQQLVQDVITGLFILLEDTLAIGDVVDTGDRAGTVEALTIRTVKIRDGDGALHTIPFSTVKALKNSSRGFGVYTVGITLAQGADVAKALEVLEEVGDEIHKDPKYQTNIIAPLDVWGVDQVGLDGIVIKAAIKTRPLQQYGIGREINRRMNLRLRELGIPLATRGLNWTEQPGAPA